MNYSMKVNSATAPSGINLRSALALTQNPLTQASVIGSLNVDVNVQGDLIKTDVTGKKWLQVLEIDGTPTAVETYAAHWLLVDDPIEPVIYPDYVLSLAFSSDTGIEVKYTTPDGVSSVLGTFPNGKVEIKAANPTMELI